MSKEDLGALPWLMSFETSKDMRCPDFGSKEEAVFGRAVFAQLGTTDLDGQLAHLAACERLAREKKEEAHERVRRLSRVYASTGVCAGMGLGLLLW